MLKYPFFLRNFVHILRGMYISITKCYMICLYFYRKRSLFRPLRHSGKSRRTLKTPSSVS